MNKDNLYKIIDNPLLSQRIFFPRKQKLDKAFYVDCGQYKLACYQEINYPKAKTLVYFHGNGEVVDDYIPSFCELVRSLGFNLFLAEYPGYGGSTGSPSMSKLLRDIDHIFDSINQPQEKLVVFGRSLGSIPAIDFAYRYPSIAGLIIESGIYDVLERLLIRVTVEEFNTSMDILNTVMSELFDHKKKLNNFKNPVLIMHAKKDILIPVYHAEKNYESCGGAKELVVFDQGDHNSILVANWSAYIKALSDFTKKL